MQVSLDGKEKILEGVYNISVGKTFYIASGLKVCNELQPQDSRFYVLAVRNLSWKNVWPVLRAVYSGRPIASSACLSLEYAREVSFSFSTPQTEVEFDGDPAGWCPCQIEMAPDSLDLIAPL